METPSTQTIKQWALGYLYVLNDEETLAELHPEEREIAGKSVMGCLANLGRYLEEHGSKCYDAINLREKINGETVENSTDKWNTLLLLATKVCAREVYRFLRELDYHDYCMASDGG